jgi:hypothetical protein
MDITCPQCPATLWTDGKNAQIGRGACKCQRGSIGGDCTPTVAGVEVQGVPDTAFNGHYRWVGTKNGKDHWNNGNFDLYWAAESYTGAIVPACVGRWYIGEISVAARLKVAVNDGGAAAKRALYTILSPCTAAAYPPNSNGVLNWQFIGLTKVKLVPFKLLTVE